MNKINGIIYKAENIVNGKVYIGQTIRNINVRKSIHKNNALKGESNIYFHRAIRKHGFDNFEWSILCECDSKEKLNAIEKFYISAYRKMTEVYNVTDGGEGALGYKPTEETLKKLSESHIGKKSGNKGNIYSEEIRKKISDSKKKYVGELNPFYGKKHSPESIKKMSDAKRGMYSGEKNPMFGVSLSSPNKGKKMSDEQRKKISESLKGNIPWNKGLKKSTSVEVI